MEKIKVSIDDFQQFKKLGNLTLSPSGSRAAFTVTQPNVKDNNYRTDIWLYDEAKDSAPIRLTTGEDGSAPIFEDEDHILFAADRKKRHPAKDGHPNTVFNRICVNGGEAEEVFVLPFAASSLKKLGDSTYLVCGRRRVDLPDFSAMTDEEKAAANKELEADKDYEVFDELPFWFNGQGTINKLRKGLFLCDVKADTQTLLTDLYLDVEGYSLNASGSQVILWGSRFTSLNEHKMVMYACDLSTFELKEVDLQGLCHIPGGSYCGDCFIFLGSACQKYGTNENPCFYLLQEDHSFLKIADPDITIGTVGSDIAGAGSSWQGDDGYYFLWNRSYQADYMKMTPDGQLMAMAAEPGIISAAAGKEDRVFLIGMEKDRAQELYIQKDGQLTRLSSFNQDYFDSHETARTEHFTFEDSDGVTIDGWILYPEDFDPEKKYPGILNVHGGPCVAYGEGFFHEMQYWAGLGYLCFFCNPRGSSGKGNEFANIYGPYYGVRDYNDLMEFTDAVIARVPQLDVSRIGMTGGSYGGFMANWIIGHTDRFAAVASCRSISNYFSKCLTTDIGYYHNLNQIQCDPWNSPEVMWKHSPLAYADKAVTPTLFIQSDQDYRCWMGDAVQMLQALLMHGVPARMCLFHGENHELSRSGKPVHRVRRIKEITQWFDQYLKEDR